MRRKRIVVLPDLFVDALAFLPPWRKASRALDAIARRGGGNYPVPAIDFKLGGNAANLALALARLGARTELIAHTNPIGHALLRRAAAGTPLGTAGVRVGSAGSASLVLECGPSNVMISHAGPLSDFGPEQLTPDDWQRIESADAVAMVNWAQNRRGTALLRALSRRVGGRGAFLYFDTGDVRHRADVPALRSSRSLWKGVSAFGMNQNELGSFCAGTGVRDAQQLAQELDTRIDLHARTWAASVTADSSTRVAADRTPAQRLTGAGDAWNAGNLAGYLLEMDARARLGLAHRVATHYVAGPSGLPPLASEVLR